MSIDETFALKDHRLIDALEAAENVRSITLEFKLDFSTTRQQAIDILQDAKRIVTEAGHERTPADYKVDRPTEK